MLGGCKTILNKLLQSAFVLSSPIDFNMRTSTLRNIFSHPPPPPLCLPPRPLAFLSPSLPVPSLPRPLACVVLCCRCLWVWSTLEAKLTALVVQIEPIVCAQWRPYVPLSATDNKDSRNERMLAYCTGTTRIYFWRSKGDSIGGEVSWSNMGNTDESCSQPATTSITTSTISPPSQKQLSKWLICLQ